MNTEFTPIWEEPPPEAIGPRSYGRVTELDAALGAVQEHPGRTLRWPRTYKGRGNGRQAVRSALHTRDLNESHFEIVEFYDPDSDEAMVWVTYRLNGEEG